MATIECPECRKRIAGAGSPAGFRKRLLAQELALRQAVKEQRLRHISGGLLSLVRLRTILAWGLAGACSVGWWFASATPQFAQWSGVIIPIGVIGLVVLVSSMIGDLAWLSVRRRRSPADALAAFIRAMEIGRYGEAQACVLPGDRNNRPRRPVEADAEEAGEEA